MGNYLTAVSEYPKTCCLFFKIPIFTGLRLGVLTLILGNPFCPSDTNPSLELFFLVSIMRSRQIWLENFTFFNQILKLFFSNGGKLRDIEHRLCSIVLETFTLLHINGFLLLNFIDLALFCVQEGYTSPIFAIAIFGTKSLKTFESSFL